MQGLELCRRFYEDCGAPAIEARFGVRATRIAAGLAGAGSDCLGFDDEISRDHDFGPAFCLWLTDKDYTDFGAELRRVYEDLPREYLGIRRTTEPQGADRIGVMRIGDFYARFTGCRDVPRDDISWLRIPEHLLAAAVSGEVFRDELGEFSRIRAGLAAFYPRDVRLKKLASRVFTMAQSGQYNYPRMKKRGDAVASAFALAEFARAALSAFHLIDKKYMPYYKWAYRSALNLAHFRAEAEMVASLFVAGTDCENVVEAICAATAKALVDRGLSESRDPFLVAHAQQIMCRIGNDRLRNLGITVG